MEVYKKWVAKSAAVTALWCVLELNVKVPMKVRHVSEHNMRFSRKSLPSPCRSLWPAWSAHSAAWKGAEEAGCCSVVRASSKPAIANRKWKPRLGVHLPQVPYAFDFFFHRRLRSCWIYTRSAAVDPFLHTCSHVWKDEQKITSDSFREAAAATRVPALFPKFLKELYQIVGWEKPATEALMWCWYLEREAPRSVE